MNNRSEKAEYLPQGKSNDIENLRAFYYRIILLLH